MTTILNLITDLNKLRPIDMEKMLTLNGMPIQGISIKENKTEFSKPVLNNDGEPVYEEDEEGNILKDDNGNPIAKYSVQSTTSTKISFVTGKQNDEFKNAKNLLAALNTLTLKEKLSSVCYGDDDIFVLGDYQYSDRVNIDTDESVDEYTINNI